MSLTVQELNLLFDDLEHTVIGLNTKLNNAYSYKRYRDGWIPCINMLRKQGYNDIEVEAILRSKYTRWAADAGGKRYGYATARDLKNYMDSFCTADIIQDLVEQTFNKPK